MSQDKPQPFTPSEWRKATACYLSTVEFARRLMANPDRAKTVGHQLGSLLEKIQSGKPHPQVEEG